MIEKILLIALTVSLLTGCGFKLRGNTDLSAALNPVSIEGGDRAFTGQLETLLKNNGTTVVGNDVESATIVISRVNYEREVRETNARGLATGYSYRYTVIFEVADAQGQVLQPKASISQYRTLDFDPESILEAEYEEEFLREGMEREITLQIMRRLSRL